MEQKQPLVGIIYARDKHPSAKRLADLQSPETASLVLCDEVLDLDQALSREWEEADAHFLTYRVDADAAGDEYAFARLSKRSPVVAQLERAGGSVKVTMMVFDHDLPKVDNKKTQWDEDSQDDFLVTVDMAVEAGMIPQPTWFYTTLHGSRFVYVLEEETSPSDAEAIARGIIASFADAGIELDEACKDWTRLFRLPKTVRPDADEPFHDSELFIFLENGPRLKNSEAPRIEASDFGEEFLEVSPYAGAMPDPDEVRDLLTHTGKNGRQYESELVKVAKKFLQGRDAFDICFGNAPLAKGEANWNNQVTKTVGQCVGMLARQEAVSPEGVYALLHSAVEQLQARESKGANATNWFEKTWDLVARLWANEESQIAAEREAHEKKQFEAEEHREVLIEQVRSERPEDVPEDETEAREWFMRRMIASDGRRHHVMRTDGSYNIRPVSDSMLIPMIMDLEMGEIIPTTEVRGKSVAQRSTQAILNDHATPITSIECSSRERVAYIEGGAGQKVLHVPVHRLNSKLQEGGVFDERVDQWLRALGGSHYDQLVEWLSHALDVRRAICALNLYGAPGTGKGMLAAGLAECFEGEQRNDGRALGKFNVGLLDSPIVNCDEGVPKITSDEALTVDQAFRSLVTGGRVTIRAMHRDPFNADIYPRILFTSNDRDIIRSIVGHRDLTVDDIRAIELRLLSIPVSDSAQTLLTAHGNYSYTAGWVAGQKRSQYILANHIYYLFNNRKKARAGTGRLLVEGEVSTQLVREMRLRSKGAQTVLRALIMMIESPTGRRGFHSHEGNVWVTPAGVVEYTEAALTALNADLSLVQAGRVLRQFSLEDLSDRKVMMTNPPGTTRDQRARWVKLDLAVLFEEAVRHGITATQLRALLSRQEGGPEKIEAILNMELTD